MGRAALEKWSSWWIVGEIFEKVEGTVLEVEEQQPMWRCYECGVQPNFSFPMEG
jgi:hypothetical protein